MLVLGLAELCAVSLVAIALRVVAMSANEDLEEEMSLLVVARRLSSLEAVSERVEAVSEWLKVRFFRSIVVVACWMMLASRKVLETRLVHVSVRRVDTLLATVLARSEERSSMDSSVMRNAIAWMVALASGGTLGRAAAVKRI